MKIIYKYNLAPKQAIQFLDIPEGAQILKVDEQMQNLVFWALVDLERPTVRRIFGVFTTGSMLPSSFTDSEAVYLNTVKLADGTSILHVFELIDND